MAGLVPAIHVFDPARSARDVDGRDKRGHDELVDDPWYQAGLFARIRSAKRLNR